MTEQLLEGIRVLDFTDFLAGPYCGMYFADMGADVIKVENLRSGGNFVRGARPLEKTTGRSMYFQNLNRNKRGVAVDLKTDDGKKLFADLVKSADVLLENNRPGVMEQLGGLPRAEPEADLRIHLWIWAVRCQCEETGL